MSINIITQALVTGWSLFSIAHASTLVTRATKKVTKKKKKISPGVIAAIVVVIIIVAILCIIAFFIFKRMQKNKAAKGENVPMVPEQAQQDTAYQPQSQYFPPQSQYPPPQEQAFQSGPPPSGAPPAQGGTANSYYNPPAH
ncbi:Pre-mRNA-processing-splicing factor 8 [Venturia nashicola]|uniref:Pre-mRNA-processing-splicing factor 8 n=1 Tax=Venturia nashicola TaxID=86259 RepID=A0A4Z1NX34_9PEZI|nr:Pre-mRNA-processing-splicing factor 8 [Venturia nashicola]